MCSPSKPLNHNFMRVVVWVSTCEWDEEIFKNQWKWVWIVWVERRDYTKYQNRDGNLSSRSLSVSLLGNHPQHNIFKAERIIWNWTATMSTESSRLKYIFHLWLISIHSFVEVSFFRCGEWPLLINKHEPFVSFPALLFSKKEQKSSLYPCL